MSSLKQTLIILPEPNPKTIRLKNDTWEEIEIFERVPGRTMSGKFKLVRKLFQEAKWPAILAHYGFNYVMGGITPYTNVACRQNFRVDLSNCRSERLADIPQDMFAFGYAAKMDSIYVVSGLKKNNANFGSKFPEMLVGCFKYSIVENIWSKLPDLYYGRISPNLMIMDEKLYCVAGLGETNSIYVLDLKRPVTW